MAYGADGQRVNAISWLSDWLWTRTGLGGKTLWEEAMITSRDYAKLIDRYAQAVARAALDSEIEPDSVYDWGSADALRDLNAAIEALLAENARLSAFEVDDSEECHRIHKLWWEACKTCDSLRAQVAALEKDAARYRYVRNSPNITQDPDIPYWLVREQLDEAVDAALTRSTP